MIPADDSSRPPLSPLDDPWLEPDELEDPIYDEVFRMVYVDPKPELVVDLEAT